MVPAEASCRPELKRLGMANSPDTELALKKAEIPVITVKPSQGWAALNLRDLWIYRELIYFMTWRNLKVRYKQTLLGAFWAILRPFLSMVVFSIFFGGLAQVPSDNIPCPIFSYSGLLPWELFSVALVHASQSLVQSSNMITKIYFPRVILPLASVLSGLVDFMIAFVVLLGMMLYYHITPTAAVWTLPLFLLLALVTGLGVSLWLSAMNVMYRDINYILPFLNQLWMYITPIVYSSTLVPANWQYVYAINPMAGVVQGFRWALLGTNPPGPMIWVSVAVAIGLLISGLFYFRRMEHIFADNV
jgi:lipopolysaccharide transport system permease protein